VFTGPLTMPAWKPWFVSPKEVVDAMKSGRMMVTLAVSAVWRLCAVVQLEHKAEACK
jgi:hypothetical protein